MGKHFVIVAALLTILISALLLWQKEQTVATATDFSTLLTKQQAAFPPLNTAPLLFPDAHGAHLDTRSESWHFSGLLQDDAKARYGFVLAFFRLNLGNDLSLRESPWAAQQIYRAYLSITPEQGPAISFTERISRAAIELAGYSHHSRKLWLQNWYIIFPDITTDRHHFVLHAASKELEADLTLQANKPISETLDRPPFRFYSIGRMRVGGKIRLNNKFIKVTGNAFFEHLWGNIPFNAGQIVWNRFSLQLAGGRELLLLQSRRRDGSGTPINSALIISKDAGIIELNRRELTVSALNYWRSPITGVEYPLTWHISVPEHKLDLKITPLLHDQEARHTQQEWNGTVLIDGIAEGIQFRGNGHVQLTGYSNVQ